jgi:hypothetical protein
LGFDLGIQVDHIIVVSLTILIQKLTCDWASILSWWRPLCDDDWKEFQKWWASSVVIGGFGTMSSSFGLCYGFGEWGGFGIYEDPISWPMGKTRRVETTFSSNSP